MTSLVLGILLGVSPQEPGSHTSRPVPNLPGLLSTSELSQIMTKVDSVLVKVLKKLQKPKPLVWKPGTATRSQIFAEFDRTLTWIEPEIKFKPRMIKFDSKRLTSVDPKLTKLIEWGFVAKVGPLATNKVESVGIADFGDALGLYLSRLADLTHMPNSLFTPSLQPPIK